MVRIERLIIVLLGIALLRAWWMATEITGWCPLCQVETETITRSLKK